MNPTDLIENLYSKDLFTQWLGIERIAEGAGFCTLQMLVRPEMCNGFGIAHGGITYSLADSALAFASNSHGRQALSLETSISHLKPLVPGDMIIATAREKHLSHKIGVYEVTIENENGMLVALFKGTVYRKG